MRYGPTYEHLRSFLQVQKEPPYWIECSFYRRARRDPRMVVESGIHGINFLEYLLGEIHSVTALQGNKKALFPLQHGESEEQAEVTAAARESMGMSIPASVPVKGTPAPKAAFVEFRSGTKGLLKFFPCTGKAIEWYEFQGDGYSAYLRMAQPFLDELGETLSIYQQEKEGKEARSTEYADNTTDPLVQQGFMGEYEEFLHIVMDPSVKSRSTFQNALSSMAVAEAIEEGEFKVFKGLENSGPGR